MPTSVYTYIYIVSVSLYLASAILQLHISHCFIQPVNWEKFDEDSAMSGSNAATSPPTEQKKEAGLDDAVSKLLDGKIIKNNLNGVLCK